MGFLSFNTSHGSDDVHTMNPRPLINDQPQETSADHPLLKSDIRGEERPEGRSDEEGAIIAALESAGHQDITLTVVPKRFLFSDGQRQTELEFSRNYFDDTTLVTLQCLMGE